MCVPCSKIRRQGGTGLAPAAGLIRGLSAFAGVTHVPNDMLSQFGNTCDRVEQRFKTSDGLIRADYLIATGVID